MTIKNQKSLKEHDSNGNGFSKDTDDTKYPRPSRMKKPKVYPKSYRRYFDEVYLQDLALDVLQDKYGNTRGQLQFDYFLDHNFHAIYPVCEEIMSEKAKMLNDLGEQIPRDYFAVSYFQVWKTWMMNLDKISKGETIQTKEQGTSPVRSESVVKLAQKLIKESYNKMSVYEQTTVDIILSNNKERVTNQLRIVEKLQGCLKDKKEKVYIKECIQTLRSKLSKMTLAEAASKTLELKEQVINLLEVAEAGETEVKLPNTKYLKNIRVKCLEDVEAPATLFITFSLEFYPAGHSYSELQRSLHDLNTRFSRLGRNILNQVITWREKKEYFTGQGIWEGSVRLNDVKAGDKVRGVGELVLDTTVDKTPRTLYQYLPGVNEVLTDLDEFIPRWFSEIEPQTETEVEPVSQVNNEPEESLSDDEINNLALQKATTEKEPVLNGSLEDLEPEE